MTAHFAQGDIVRVDFDPSAGHEQIKRRYAVVVSNAAFNRICNLTMVCPITSTDNGYPLHVDLQETTTLLGTSAITGFVQIEQLKSLDLHARHAQYCGTVSDAVRTRLTELILACVM